MRIKSQIKLLLRLVYIKSFKNFSIGTGSHIGQFSRIMFSSESNLNLNQSITLGNYAAIGKFSELHVWDNNHIFIKDNSTLNDGCKIFGDVTIESHCLLSSNIFASSGNHYAFVHPTWLIKEQDNFVLASEQGRRDHSKHIQIEEDCWIGYGVFIKQGVYIGRGAIIGANSAILKDVKPYSVQAGSPAREIRTRLAFSPPTSISANIDENLPYFYRGFHQKRAELKISRQENIIFAKNECVVLLSSGAFGGIQFAGKKNRNLHTLKLVVAWQGLYEWELSIESEFFEYTLLKKDVLPEVSEQSTRIWSRFGKAIADYNVILFYLKNSNDISHPFGISEIKITP